MKTSLIKIYAIKCQFVRLNFGKNWFFFFSYFFWFLLCRRLDLVLYIFFVLFLFFQMMPINIHKGANDTMWKVEYLFLSNFIWMDKTKQNETKHNAQHTTTTKMIQMKQLFHSHTRFYFTEKRTTQSLIVA